MSSLKGNRYAELAADITPAKSVPEASMDAECVTVDGGTIGELPVEEAILEMAGGITVELATKAAQSLKAKMEGVDAGPIRRQGSQKVDEMAQGMHLYQTLIGMMDKGGVALTAIIKSDFDLDEFVRAKREENSLNEQDIEAIKVEHTKRIQQPDSKVFEMTAEMAVADFQDKLRQQFDERYLRESNAVSGEELSEQDLQGSVPAQVRTKRGGNKPSKAQKEENIDEFIDNGPAWMESKEHRQLEAFKRSKHIEWTKAYLQALDLYEKALDRKEEREAKLERLKNKQQKDVVLEICASGLQVALVLMLSKIKSAVKDSPDVSAKLRGRVRVGTNGPMINDPLTSGNLTGIYYILHREYHKPSLSLFTSLLLDLMSKEVSLEACESKPYQGLIEIQRAMSTWDQLGLWKFMNQDKFWTVCLLKSYHPKSDLREKAVMKVISYAKDLERRGEYGPGNDTPMFNYISDWITEVYCKSKDFAATATKKSSTGNASKSANSQWGRSNGTEEAAKADARPMSFTGTATGPYTKEIHRDQYLCCVSIKDGKRHLYTATRKPCAECKGEDKHPSPVCFLGQCQKCGLYGHRDGQCCQQQESEEAHCAEWPSENGCEEAYSVMDRMILKFDSGASNCMSGNPNRIKKVNPHGCSVAITGFNGDTSVSTTVGVNEDNKKEYYVSGMPKDLALLCANVYASEGVAMLFKEDGIVLRLTNAEQDDLRKYISRYPVSKRLIVRNRTYEVDHGQEEAYSNTATRFYNSKVNVSNATQLILTHLMTGLTFNDWYRHIKNKSLDGIHQDITVTALNSFEHQYGRNPDIIRLAMPMNHKSQKGLMNTYRPIQAGERIEVDIMSPDYNCDEDGGTKKLPSHGGAIAGAVCVDVGTGFTHGKLIKNNRNLHLVVAEFLDEYVRCGVSVKLCATDDGMGRTQFQVWTPALEELLLRRKVKSEKAEPHNHERGTATVERAIRSIKELIRIAILLFMRNPNRGVLGFSETNILKLWGELFQWAINIINLKPSPRNPNISRYQAFTGVKPNVQNIRILPIFSVVLIFRPPTNHKPGSGLRTNQNVNTIGLYIGPSMKTPGSIRAAIMSHDKLCIVVTSKFTCATDGGGLNVYPSVTKGLRLLLDWQQQQYTETLVEQDEFEVVIESDTTQGVTMATDATQGVTDATQGVTMATDATQGVTMATDATQGVTMATDATQGVTDATQGVTMATDATQGVTDATQGVTMATDATQGVTMATDATQGVTDATQGVTMATDTTQGSVLENKGTIDKQNGDVYAKYYPKKRARDRSQIALSAMATEKQIFFSFEECAYVIVCDEDTEEEETAYKAVTDNVPRTFKQALNDKDWGDAARKEWDTLINTKTIVEMDPTIATEDITKHQANLVLLFPVYEVKQKEGMTVYKVRLVADGRTHHNSGDTYAATPSRLELLLLLHLAAVNDWSIIHVDESRAFLNAPYAGEHNTYAKLPGEHSYYQVLKALYGLKTSPKDYQTVVQRRMASMGFTPLVKSTCLYKMNEGQMLVYDYVDDYLFMSPDTALLSTKIEELRKCTTTSSPVIEPTELLGMEICRYRDRNIILVSMKAKIKQTAERLLTVEQLTKSRKLPMPINGFLIRDEEYAELDSESKKLLDKKDKLTYMAMVGSLNWIAGVRHDITLVVQFLSWFTRSPLNHHLKMATHCLQYLYSTLDLPLVLGGVGRPKISAYCDASLGSATRGRSIIGQMVKLNTKAGCIIAKSSKTLSVYLSSFESELDGAVAVVKSVELVSDILTELGVDFDVVSDIYNDNEAMVNFIKRKGSVNKAVRHVELRQWFIRDKIDRGKYNVFQTNGVDLPPDKLTKLANKVGQKKFTWNALGLELLQGVTIQGVAEYGEVCIWLLTESENVNMESESLRANVTDGNEMDHQSRGV